MSCFVPHFSCIPFPRTPHVKATDSVCFRRHCALSATTTVVDIEKPQPPSLEPLTYLRGIDSPAKRNFRATWETETLLTSEEEGIAAAAAEAVALARAALEVAKDAAQMIGHDQSVKLEKSDDFLTEFDILQLERVKLNEMEQDDSANDSATVGSKTRKACISQIPYTDTDASQFMDQDQQTTHSESIAVRSGRQTERRARRVRAAGKAADSIVTPKPQSSLKKKRPALQEIDYSDPLRYLRGTTSTSKLLTATEELDLSEGIQVLLKLERLQEELTEKNGCQPTFSQWADAAGVDQRTLRKQLNHGTMCKDKMVKSNIRLVISIAKNYQGAGLNLQDLVQEGCRGLVKGAEKFDASKGFKFSTYAHWWIKQAVRKSLSDQSRTIRLPVIPKPNQSKP